MPDESEESLANYLANFRTVTTGMCVRLGDEVTWRIVHRTPVDTGRARGNWVAGLDAPNTDVDEERYDPDGAPTCANAHEVFARLKLGQTMFLTNSLPYINALEHGHSQKAPEGMIAVTEAEIPTILMSIQHQDSGSFLSPLHGSGPVEGNQMVMQGGE